MRPLPASCLKQLESFLVQHEEWFPRRLTADLDVMPANGFADTGAEGLRHGFLGSKTGGDMRERLAMGFAELDLPGQQEALQEGIAKAVNRRLHTRRFYQVYAESEDQVFMRLTITKAP